MLTSYWWQVIKFGSLDPESALMQSYTVNAAKCDCIADDIPFCTCGITSHACMKRVEFVIMWFCSYHVDERCVFCGFLCNSLVLTLQRRKPQQNFWGLNFIRVDFLCITNSQLTWYCSFNYIRQHPLLLVLHL